MSYHDHKKNSGRNRKLIPFILVSIVAHSLLFLIKINIAGDQEKEHLVNIQYYDLKEHSEKKDALKPEIPKTKKEKQPEGQIVDIAKPEIQKKPEKSKFLSEYDSSVKKDTRSDFDKNIRTRGKKLQKKLEMEITGKETNEKDVVVAGDKNKPVSDKLEKIKKGELKGFDGTDGQHTKGEEQPESGLLTGTEDKNEDGTEYIGGRSIPRRFLPYTSGKDSSLMSPSNDFLKDVDQSDETALNTHKYLYASYFNKIKQAVSRHWTPAYVLMINDPKGHMYGRKNRYTKIIALINANGSLASIKLETSSGMDFLDREAINAFKMAAPFHNPPESLLSEDGTLEIRFGFMVSME